MTVIAITHPAAEVPRFFRAQDLALLTGKADVRILDSQQADQVIPLLGDVDIILSAWGIPKIDAALLAAAPRLRAVCYAGGTVKPFVTPELWARGITVTTGMHANAIPVAEVTEALVVLANKDWFTMRRVLHEQPGRFNDLHHVPHHGNYGTTVGVIGFGAIGRLVIERLRRHDFTILVYDPYAKAEAIQAAGGEKVDDLLELARRSAVSTLHAPDIPATAGMCGAAFFAAMPEGATFINTARGRLVDEAALIAACASGRIQAHIDVTWPEPPAVDSPLFTLPNLYVTPHRAGSTAGEYQRCGRYAIDECLRLIAGEPPRYPVTESMLATMA